jgi:hypothetical protein
MSAKSTSIIVWWYTTTEDVTWGRCVLGNEQCVEAYKLRRGSVLGNFQQHEPGDGLMTVTVELENTHSSKE